MRSKLLPSRDGISSPLLCEVFSHRFSRSSSRAFRGVEADLVFSANSGKRQLAALQDVVQIGEAMDDFLRDLMAYGEWANAVFFNAWEKSPARDHEEMRTRVGHIVGVQSGFISLFKGEHPGGPPDGPPPTFDELRARAEKSHADLNEFIASIDSQALSQIIHVPWFPDPPCVISVGQALVQVAMHTQHHRGQCMTRLKDFGGQAKNVDWIIWLWQQKPKARWHKT